MNLRARSGLLVSAGLVMLTASAVVAPATAATLRAGNQCKKRDAGKVVGQLRCTTVAGPKYIWQRVVPAGTQVDGAAPGCDPNYTPCVPIDSDVDCSSGRGNGPSYARGPVRVIGDDIYGLDSNGDGVGCEKG